MKTLTIVLMFIFTSPTAMAGVCSGDSFTIKVQKEVFAKVASIMNIDANESPPPVICAEEMTDKEFADAIGMDIWGSKRGNFFSWNLNVVILTATRSMVHVLAHEFVHYFQYHYYWDGDSSKWNDRAEYEAIMIQKTFKGGE